MVYVFVGTRPEAIKLAPLVHRLELSRKQGSKLIPVTVNTAQHTDLLSVTAASLGLSFNITFRARTTHNTLGSLFSRVYQQTYQLLGVSKAPTIAVVQGDTTTSLAAALAAAYHHIPVAHVEAGLRTFDTENPFPEEINRRLIDHASSLLFPPTQFAMQALLREGIDPEKIHMVGNTVVDALQQQQSLISNKQPPAAVAEFLKFAGRFEQSSCKVTRVLVTMHRRESHGDIMRRMFQAIRDGAAASLEEGRCPVAVLLPLHPNPNVKAAANLVFATASNASNVMLTAPLSYQDLVALYDHLGFIMTDSGGIQEESVSLGIPTVVLRNMTERPEGIMAGVLDLMSTSPENVYKSLSDLAVKGPPKATNTARGVYGTGNSSVMIEEALAKQAIAGQNDTQLFLAMAKGKAIQEELAVQSTAATAPSQLHPLPVSFSGYKSNEQLPYLLPANRTYAKLMSLPSEYDPQQSSTRFALTVVYSFYRRPYLVERAFDALLASTHRPVEIWASVFSSPHAAEILAAINAYKAAHPNLTVPIFVAQGDMQLGYWGRFQVALQAKTPYVAVFDDDCIPGTKFLANTFHVANLGTYAGVFGIKGHDGMPFFRTPEEVKMPMGTANTAYLKPVDLVGGMWFMRSEHLHLLFRDSPVTWNTGEDVTLCRSMRVYGGMNCYIMPMNYSDPETVGVSHDFPQISAKGDTTGSAAHPMGGRHDQERVYHYLGDVRMAVLGREAANRQCGLLLYADHASELTSMRQLISSMMPVAARPGFQGCDGIKLYVVASYGGNARQAAALVSQLQAVDAYILQPGLSYDGQPLTNGITAVMTDALARFSSVLGAVQPRAVLMNVTRIGVETHAVLSASKLHGYCVVGVVDGSSSLHSQSKPDMVHEVVHAGRVLHEIGDVPGRLAEALSRCTVLAPIVSLDHEVASTF